MTHLVWALLLQQWEPNGLDKMLYPIAMIESSFGINVKHQKHNLGIHWTAFGALGLKPVVAHEDYLNSQYARAKYPGLEKIEEFTIRFISDVRFYNFACNLHFYMYLNQGHDLTDVVYQWRYGKTHAATIARADKINDPYVIKYFNLIERAN